MNGVCVCVCVPRVVDGIGGRCICMHSSTAKLTTVICVSGCAVGCAGLTPAPKSKSAKTQRRESTLPRKVRRAVLAASVAKAVAASSPQMARAVVGDGRGGGGDTAETAEG